MAKQKRNFVASILSEHETLYYGDSTALTIPTQTDIITILPFHTPMIAKLGKGKIIVRNGHEKNDLGEIKSGLVYVGENEVVVLVNL